jgi:hypothetical protein
MHLHHHTLLPSVPISHLGNPVTRSTNFDEDFALYIALRRRDHQLSIFRITSGSASKIGLVLFTLRVREVRTFVGVQREAETTF